MALADEQRAIRRITADELLRMVDAGVFADPRPIELLDGVLLEVSEGEAHQRVTMLLLQWLAHGLAERRYLVRIDAPLRISDPLSLPQPDVAVVDTTWASRPAHPDASLLVIEVSVSSLQVDLRVKAPKYAQADVPEYWVLDVVDRRLHIFSEPTPRGYARHEERAAAGTITPQAVEVGPLDLAALFAGPE